MKLGLITVLVAGLMSVAPAFAATPVTIDFEGATSFGSIADFYNGGTDNYGASGANLGVSFGGDALAVQNDALGPYFSNNFTPNVQDPTSSLTVMMAAGPDATMNVMAGFTGEVSLTYSSTAGFSIGVWSGLNGTGTKLADFGIAYGNAQSNGCSDSAFCNWQLATLAFNGVAKSMTFGDAANVAGFDNITITAVPEPTEALMLALGLGVVAQVVRRARRMQASV